MTERESLKILAGKYGAALIIYFLNAVLMPYVIFFLVGGLVRGMDRDSTLYFALYMTVNALSVYLVPLVSFHLLFAKEMPDPANLPRYNRFLGESVLIFFGGVAAASVCSVVSNIIYHILNLLFDFPLPEEAFSSTMPQNAAEYFIFVFFTGAVAAVCEEILFRHYLLRPLRRYGDMTAALVSALLFGLYHANLDQFAYTSVLGFFLAILAIRANSILPCIILHSLNNMIVDTVAYLPDDLGSDSLNEIFDAIVPAAEVVLDVLTIGGLVGLIIMVLKKMFRLGYPETAYDTTDIDGAPAVSFTVKQQLAAIFTAPAFIVGLVCVIIMAFI